MKAADLASVLLAASLLAGCGDPEPGQSDAVVPRWPGSTDLVITGPGADGESFAAVSGVAADSAGRVFVADAERQSVSAFDSTGRFLYAIGGEGSGPGQFRKPCCLATGPDGTLWVRDLGGARYLGFSPGAAAATLVASRPGASTFGAIPHRLTFDRDGRLVDIVIRPSPDGQTRMLRFHLDSAGVTQSTDTILAPPSDSIGVHQVVLSNNSFGFVSQPYGPRLLVAHGPGGAWARAVSSRYHVSWGRGDGADPATVRRDITAPALSTRERMEADSILKAQAIQVGESPSTLPFGVPGSKTPIAGVLFDQEGRLWVQLSGGDGEVSRADVWEEPGRRVAVVEWPRGVDLGHGYIGRDVAYGVSRDSSGAPRVVRVRFRR